MYREAGTGMGYLPGHTGRHIYRRDTHLGIREAYNQGIPQGAERHNQVYHRVQRGIPGYTTGVYHRVYYGGPLGCTTVVHRVYYGGP